jgi:hypothetical protein
MTEATDIDDGLTGDVAVPASDWTLEMLVNFANIGLGFGVTLVVQGTVVTGTLIGGLQYMEQMAAAIEKGTANSSNPGIGQSIARLYIVGKEPYERPQGDENWMPPKDGYIHLDNAVIFDGPHTTNLGLWRGRISEVAGYNFGSLERT